MKPTAVQLHEVAVTDGGRVRFQVPRASGGFRPVAYADLDRAVAEVAAFLDARGLPSEAPACIFASNSIAWVEAALGIQAAGGALIPIYPSSTPEQVGYVIEHSAAFAVFVAGQELLERLLRAPALEGVGTLVLIGDLDLPGALAAIEEAGGVAPELGERVVSFAEAREIGRASLASDPDGHERRLAELDRARRCLMLYTSGTTGHPKGVPLTYDNVLSNSEDWLEVLGPMIPSEPVDLLWLPMSHIFGWGEVCLGFELGFTSYLANPQNVLELLPEVQPSVFMSVPAYWDKIASTVLSEETEGGDAAQRGARLRTLTGGRLGFCLSGGAGLEVAVKELFEEAGLLLIEGYGLTEASPTLTMNRPDAYRFDSVGLPFPRVRLRLAPDGEIQARGPNVFAGYHRDPEATRAAFTEDGWLKTGDLGELLEGGFLRIVGRKKDILVTAGGKNVPPANIESQFAQDELIQQVVVYGDGKKYLVAGVWLDEAASRLNPEVVERTVAEKVERVNAKLARHETIKKFKVMPGVLTVESGLLTPTLKIKRARIHEAFREAFEEMYR